MRARRVAFGYGRRRCRRCSNKSYYYNIALPPRSVFASVYKWSVLLAFIWTIIDVGIPLGIWMGHLVKHDRL